jgi:photosystem II stability/assembly factor-like uncharacterized protein
MKHVCQFLLLIFLMIVNVSTLSAQWVQTNGPTSTEILSLVFSDTNLFAGTFGSGVFLSTNNGSTWTAVNAGRMDSMEIVMSLVVSGTNLFAGTTSGVFRSTDNGSSWAAVDTGLTNTDVACLVVSGADLFAGIYNGGAFHSTNNGQSWTPVNNGLTNSKVVSLAVSDTNIFAGTYGGVFLSTDNGENWVAVNSGLKDTVVFSLTVSGTHLFAGTRDGDIFVSTNNGASWIPSYTNTQNGSSVRSFAVSGTNIFAGIYGGGVFLSTNDGVSWSPVTTDPMSFGVSSLATNATDIFAGTVLSGVWRRPLSEMITKVKSRTGQIPSQVSLEQNYPNPFNPSTTITFTLPERSLVTLKVYDVLGREVSKLLSEEMPPVHIAANGMPKECQAVFTFIALWQTPSHREKRVCTRKPKNS